MFCRDSVFAEGTCYLSKRYKGTTRRRCVDSKIWYDVQNLFSLSMLSNYLGNWQYDLLSLMDALDKSNHLRLIPLSVNTIVALHERRSVANHEQFNFKLWLTTMCYSVAGDDRSYEVSWIHWYSIRLTANGMSFTWISSDNNISINTIMATILCTCANDISWNDTMLWAFYSHTRTHGQRPPPHRY